jgi:hypothetical protein
LFSVLAEIEKEVILSERPLVDLGKTAKLLGSLLVADGLRVLGCALL